MTLFFELLVAYVAAGLGTYVGMRAAVPRLRGDSFEDFTWGVVFTVAFWPLLLLVLLLKD